MSGLCLFLVFTSWKLASRGSNAFQKGSLMDGSSMESYISIISILSSYKCRCCPPAMPSASQDTLLQDMLWWQGVAGLCYAGAPCCVGGVREMPGPHTGHTGRHRGRQGGYTGHTGHAGHRGRHTQGRETKIQEENKPIQDWGDSPQERRKHLCALTG